MSCLFCVSDQILEMTSSDSAKSFATAAAGASGAKLVAGSGNMGDSGFKTRQRPDSIRNSNIVAAKGKTVSIHYQW